MAPSTRIVLTLALLLAAPAASAQPVGQRTPLPGAGTYHGCTGPTEEGLDIARSIVGKWESSWFDFRQLPYARPITVDAPAALHAVCDRIRTEAPPEDDYQRLSFFDAGSHYVVVTHVFDPDLTDSTIAMGIRTVGVYDRSGRYVAAVSF